MPKITKTISGKYSVRVTIKKGGQAKQVKRTFSKLADARYFAKTGTLKQQTTKKPKPLPKPKIAKSIPREKPTDSTQISLADYFLQWYLAYKEPKIQERTKRWYVHTQSILAEQFKDTPIQSITRLEYQSFINQFGENHSKETVKKINSQVKAMVRNALFDDLIAKDFTQDITLTFNQTKTKQVEYLNMEELDKLIQYCTGHLDHRYPTRYLILAAIFTGARLGELLALKWEDVDLDHRTISINKSWNTLTHKIQKTKTVSSNRVLRVNRACLDVLEQLKVNDTAMVFVSPKYNTLPSSEGANKTLRNDLHSIGLDKPGYHFHSLRHTHASMLLVKGFDIYTISKRLGHSNVSITSGIYAYEMQELKAKNDNAIEKALDNL